MSTSKKSKVRFSTTRKDLGDQLAEIISSLSLLEPLDASPRDIESELARTVEDLENLLVDLRERE